MANTTNAADQIETRFHHKRIARNDNISSQNIQTTKKCYSKREKIFCLILGVTAVVIASLSLRSRNPRIEQELVLDTKGLEKDLASRVYGQDEAVGNITRLLRRVDYEAKPYHSRPKTIFFLGGPGVGKHHVLDIISEHILCQYTDKNGMNQTCDVNYEYDDNRYINRYKKPFVEFHIKTSRGYSADGMASTFITINSLEFYLNNYKSLDNFNREIFRYYTSWWHRHNNKALHFVTGSLMSENTLKKLKSVEQYDRYLDEAEYLLNEFASKELPSYDIYMIKFKPLGRRVVAWCLKDQQVDPQQIQRLLGAYEHPQFVPLGCKTY